MMHVIPTSNLFLPKGGKLVPCRNGRLEELSGRSKQVEVEIKNLLSQKNYPCTPALRSFNRGEYQVGLYKKFGTGYNWKELRQDLLFFTKKQKESNSPYLTFWAVYENLKMDEVEFEANLWNELSHLTSEELKGIDWPTGASANPNDRNFSFCIGGESFFVVGLHPSTSRPARRFKWPVLVFNLFSQFELLKIHGVFNSTVENNRKLDNKFSGTVNPMAEKYAEKWESIQFSGKNNPSNWKCPFQFVKK